MNLHTPDPITPVRVAQLCAYGIEPDIAAVDLEMVKLKLREPEEGVAWTSEQCESAEVEYKRFLHLNRVHRDSAVVPNKIMDTMWHFHILDTRRYVTDTARLFGGYFHHYPYFGMRGEEDAQNLARAFQQTQERYATAFGEDMSRADANSCWHDCSGRCWHACSNIDAVS
jgi:hypothetical protein